MRNWIIALFMLLSVNAMAASATSDTTETIVWNRAPIKILLPVDGERRVDFPVEVYIYLPEAITDKIKVTATLEGSVFWRALGEFTTQRLIVTDKSGKYQWLLDVSAAKKAPLHTLVIHDSRLSQTSAGEIQEIQQPQTDVVSGLEEGGHDEVDLIKLAARQFYGPSRLAGLPAGVSGAMLEGDPVEIYPGGTLQTVIKGQWRTTSMDGELYVTAIGVTNKTGLEARPDPRRIRGDYLAVGTQHSWLAPAGNYPHDTTTWYLVSSRPLQETLAP